MQQASDVWKQRFYFFPDGNRCGGSSSSGNVLASRLLFAMPAPHLLQLEEEATLLAARVEQACNTIALPSVHT